MARMFGNVVPHLLSSSKREITHWALTSLVSLSLATRSI
jgi:hypothetical protein